MHSPAPPPSPLTGALPRPLIPGPPKFPCELQEAIKAYGDWRLTGEGHYDAWINLVWRIHDYAALWAAEAVKRSARHTALTADLSVGPSEGCRSQAEQPVAG